LVFALRGGGRGEGGELAEGAKNNNGLPLLPLLDIASGIPIPPSPADTLSR
jgi:hypothetical protein